MTPDPLPFGITKATRARTNVLSLLLLTLATFWLCLWLLAEAKVDAYTTQDATLHHSIRLKATQRPQINAVDPLCSLEAVTCAPDASKTLKVTAFSSIECRTTWCRAHPTLEGHQVALNARFGRHARVFIPAFGKTYDVIGTTDGNTDVDIYHGADSATARDFGVQYLSINLLD